MTTVLYHEGTLYADTKCTIINHTGEPRYEVYENKIRDYKGTAFCGSGYTAMINLVSKPFHRFMLNVFRFTLSQVRFIKVTLGDDHGYMHSNVMEFRSDKVVCYLFRPVELFVCSLVTCQIVKYDYDADLTLACGSGSELMEEALKSGKSVKEAFLEVSKKDPWTGAVFTSVKIR